MLLTQLGIQLIFKLPQCLSFVRMARDRNGLCLPSRCPYFNQAFDLIVVDIVLRRCQRVLRSLQCQPIAHTGNPFRD